MSDREFEKYYDVLELDSDATAEEITRAYNHLKTLYKEGSMATQPVDDEWDESDKRDILARIEEAYEKLMVPPVEASEAEAQIPVEDSHVVELSDESPSDDRGFMEEESLEEEFPREEIVISEPAEEISFEDESMRDETPEENMPEETGEEAALEEEEAVDVEIPPVVEEYRQQYVPEVHIEFDGGAFPDEYVEEDDGLSGFFEEEEEEPEAVETEEVKEEGVVVEEVEVEEEVHEIIENVKEDTLAEEFVKTDSATGSIFRDIRENRGFSFSELSESTQIPVEMLEYIENEDFAKLPDAGYLRWYITTYAKTLSMDPKETADLYMKRYREWKKNQD
jgi:curved DNA-binding protein CbpA